MQNNAQPYQELRPTPKQDLLRQPQVAPHDDGILPQDGWPMALPSERDEDESNVRQSTRNNAEVRREANESVRSQQARRDEHGGGGAQGSDPGSTPPRAREPR